MNPIDPFINVSPAEIPAWITDSISSLGVGQSFYGDLTFGNTNTGKVKIDGANSRILINDGTNDRILIGYQAGGF